MMKTNAQNAHKAAPIKLNFGQQLRATKNTEICVYMYIYVCIYLYLHVSMDMWDIRSRLKSARVWNSECRS